MLDQSIDWNLRLDLAASGTVHLIVSACNVPHWFLLIGSGEPPHSGGTTQCEFLAKGGSELRAEDFDGAFHFFVQESGYAHLEGEARNATESLVEVENFVGGQSRSLPISVKVKA